MPGLKTQVISSVHRNVLIGLVPLDHADLEPGLQAIGKVTRIRETGDKTSTETAYY